MSIYQEVVSHDEIFSQLTTEPIIVNDFDVYSYEQREKLNSLLYTRYEGDALDVTPSCDCSELRGEYNVGMHCKQCNTRCESSTERTIESLLWIKAPEGIHGLMNPTVWTLLSSVLTVNGCNILEWLCNPNYKVVGKVHDRLNRVVQMNLPRGYNAFYENFDFIMNELIDKRIVKDGKYQREDIRQFITENRHKIFSHFIPVPSRVGFITESTAVGTFTDMTMTVAVDAIRAISSIKSSPTPMSARSIEIRVVNAISKLASFYKKFSQKTLGGKYGLYRKHIFGGRAHFTARAVITSISEPHHYQELHTPWGMTVSLLKVHITNKMLKMGMTPIEIERHITGHILKYSPLLDYIMQELIDESPYMGIPVTFGRNPTLARASIQLFYITHVKKDPKINTISISNLALVGCNADNHFSTMKLPIRRNIDAEAYGPPRVGGLSGLLRFCRNREIVSESRWSIS